MESHNLLTSTVYPYINFLIFFAVCFIVARKPIISFFKKRKEEFDNYYKEALTLKQECEKKNQELIQRKNNLEKEINEIIESTKKSAQLEADAILDQAKKLADHIKQETLRLTTAEIDKKKQELKNEILSLVKAEVEIPSSVKSYNGHLYEVCTDSCNWIEAQSRCVARYGHLCFRDEEHLRRNRGRPRYGTLEPGIGPAGTPHAV